MERAATGRETAWIRRKLLLFISDELSGIVNAIQEVYPRAKHQKCCVHLSRNISHKVCVSDRAEICGDFRSVYRANHEEAGKAALETFCTKWQTSNAYIFTFYSFPKSIWRSIYSTNLIDSFNKQIKKYTKRKEKFPHEEAQEKLLVSEFEDYNLRFDTRCHIGFDQARAELQAMFTIYLALNNSLKEFKVQTANYFHW